MRSSPGSVVWIVNHYAQEPSGPGGTRHWSLAEHLRGYGWQTAVIAASVELNTGRNRLREGERCKIAKFGSTSFVWLRVPAHTGDGAGRVVNMLMFSIRAALFRPHSDIEPPDVVIGSSVHPFAALAGWVLARRYGVPFVFEVRDLWPQSLIDLGKLNANGLVARALRALEGFLYRQSSRIISLLPRASEYVTSMGIPPERVEWIPNGVEPGPPPQPVPLRARGKCVFMYFGAHGQANGLDNVLRAMDLARHDPACSGFRLRLVGAGPAKAALQQLSKDLGLDSVSFEPPVAKTAIPALAAEADAFVFNLVDAPVFRFGISSNKLFDFLAAGRPIVFCCDAGNNPVAEAGSGVTVPPGDPAALLEGMRAIGTMSPNERSKLGHAGRDWVVKHHSYASLAAKLASTLNAVLEEQAVNRS